jgi:hypothetical protein
MNYNYIANSHTLKAAKVHTKYSESDASSWLLLGNGFQRRKFPSFEVCFSPPSGTDNLPLITGRVMILAAAVLYSWQAPLHGLNREHHFKRFIYCFVLMLRSW